MDNEGDCSDFGLESMFDEGLQCCTNIQQRDSLLSKYDNVDAILDSESGVLKLVNNPDDQETQKKESLPSSSGDKMTTLLAEDVTRKKLEEYVSVSDSKKKSRWKRRLRNKTHIECESAVDESTQAEANASEEKGKTEEQEKKNKNKRKKRKKKITENESGEEDNERRRKPPQKKSPNYFIAIRVSNPSIHSAFQVIQDSIVAKDPLLQPALIPLNTLHITLFVMHLEKDQLPKAKEVLHECQNSLEKVVEGQNTMTFKGLGHFRNEVVFGQLVHESELAILQQTANVIKNSYSTCGLDLSLDDKPFKPHLTLMKLSRIPFKKKKKMLKKIPEDVYSSWIECELGVQHFSEVLLCSMIDKKQEDGFYHCEGSVVIAADPANLDKEDFSSTEQCANTSLTTDEVSDYTDNRAEDSIVISECFEKASSMNVSDDIENDVCNVSNHSEATSRHKPLGLDDDIHIDVGEELHTDEKQLTSLSIDNNKIPTWEDK